LRQGLLKAGMERLLLLESRRCLRQERLGMQSRE
jgi:hypothetical protein